MVFIAKAIRTDNLGTTGRQPLEEAYNCDTSGRPPCCGHGPPSALVPTFQWSNGVAVRVCAGCVGRSPQAPVRSEPNATAIIERRRRKAFPLGVRRRLVRATLHAEMSDAEASS
ncbi:unnamed protein product, partial [Iphiclides podalirius]